MKKTSHLTLTLSLSLLAAPLGFAADAKKNPAPAAAEKAAVKPAAPKAPAITDPVAVVEGAEIKKADLEEAFTTVVRSQGMPPEQAGAMPEGQKMQIYRKILDDMIIDKLISKRSAAVKVEDAEVTAMIDKIKKNLGSDEEMEKQLKASGQTLEKVKGNILNQLRAQHWVDDQVKGKDAVTDADAETFYKANPDQFKQPEKVRASHILVTVTPDAKPEVVVEKEKAAQGILARVKKGEDFAALAKELSEDPSAKQNSGDLDFFTKDQMVKEFSEAAFGMKKDDVSKEPVRSQFGYHIIKVTDRKEAETIELEKAKPQLLSFLQRQKKQEAVETLVRGIREKAEVKVNLPEAPAPELPGLPGLPPGAAPVSK